MVLQDSYIHTQLDVMGENNSCIAFKGCGVKSGYRNYVQNLKQTSLGPSIVILKCLTLFSSGIAVTPGGGSDCKRWVSWKNNFTKFITNEIMK